MAIEKLVIGKTYRVAQPNCNLMKRIRLNEFTWRFTKRRLRSGDLIKYRGHEPGWKNDNVPHDIFSKDGFRGWFNPHSIVGADVGCLEEKK